MMQILVAEDNKFFRRLLEVNLTQWGHEVIGCDDGAEAWEILDGPDSPSLAILDWEMPKMDGLELCRRVREQKDRPYIYLIMLTAKNRKEDLVEALQSGADDYIAKPFDPVELQVRVRAAARIVQLQEDLLAAFQAAEIRAKEDSLTGLWNHSAILEILQNELDRAGRHRTKMSVIMADVDHFKEINDRHGHVVGDRVLRDMSRELRSSLRSYDSVGRYGGEEFLVILPDCDETALVKLAERLRSSIAAKDRETHEGTFRCSMSFGAVVVDGGWDQSPDSIVKLADQALYAAKDAGRNRIEVYTDAPVVKIG